MQFEYEAKNNKGELITGLVQAGTRNDAITLVEEQGYEVVNMRVHKKRRGQLKFLEKVHQRDIVAFYHELALLISSDIPIVQSLKIISAQTENTKFQNVLVDIYREVNEGTRFSDALYKHKDIFGEFYIYMIRSGEASGKFDEVLNYLAREQQKDYEFKAKIKGALSYPMFILSAMLIMGTLMMAFVIPRLTAMLIESGVELPLSTKILVAVTDLFKSYWYIVLPICIGVYMLIRIGVKKTLLGRRIWHTLLLHIPQFGQSLVKKTYLVRLTRSLAVLVAGGVALTDALEISSEVVGNYYYAQMLAETTEAVKDGHSIATTFSNYPELVPGMLMQMTMVGEQTGRLDEVFQKVGDFYAKEVEVLIDNISRLLEPFIMVAMGLVVGFLVTSIMLPMFKASQAVG